MNSISRHVNAHDIVAEIRMHRQQFRGVFLIVEGATDVRRFEGCFNDDVTSFVVSWGKKNAIGALDMLGELAGYKYIGFVDRDFDDIVGKLPLLRNTVFSSGYDFDADMFDGGSFGRYLRAAADPTKLTSFGGAAFVRDHLHQTLAPVTCARFAAISGLCPSLEKIDWEQCYDGTKFNFNRLMYLLLKRSNPKPDDIERLATDVRSSDRPELSSKTCGHDLILGLGIMMRSCLGNRSRATSSVNSVQEAMYLSFSVVDFVGMSWYSSFEKIEEKLGTIVRIRL